MRDLETRPTGNGRVEFEVTISEPSQSRSLTIEFGPIQRRTIGLSNVNCHSCGGSHNDIEINRDYTVASFHAFLTWIAGELQISDTIASTGTFVNGHRLGRGEHSVLTARDEVRIGQTLITIAKRDADILERSFDQISVAPLDEPVFV